MKANNTVLASVAGVCITAAVVVGAVLGTQSHSPAAPQRPAGNPAPIASTVTVTSSASPTVAVAAKVSPSTKPPAVVRHPAKNRPAVVNQEPPVTDPTTDPASSSEPAQPAPVDVGTGTVDEGGVRRAPIMTNPPQAPTPRQHAPQPEPSPSQS